MVAAGSTAGSGYLEFIVMEYYMQRSDSDRLLSRAKAAEPSRSGIIGPVRELVCGKSDSCGY